MGDLVECPECGYTLSKAAQRYARAGLRCRHCRKCEVADFEEIPLSDWEPRHYEKTEEDRQLDKLCEGTDDDYEDNRDW